MSKLIALLISGIATVSAQTPSLSKASLEIVFLHTHASEALHPASLHSNPSERAARIHVGANELNAVDTAAAAFVAQEAALRQEAIRWHRDQTQKGQKPDPRGVAAFTARREALAATVFTNLQTGLSGAGFAGLQRYLVELGNTVQISGVGAIK